MAMVSVPNVEEDVEEPLSTPGDERGSKIRAGLGVLTVRMLRSESGKRGNRKTDRKGIERKTRTLYDIALKPF